MEGLPEKSARAKEAERKSVLENRIKAAEERAAKAESDLQVAQGAAAALRGEVEQWIDESRHWKKRAMSQEVAVRQTVAVAVKAWEALEEARRPTPPQGTQSHRGVERRALQPCVARKASALEALDGPTGLAQLGWPASWGKNVFPEHALALERPPEADAPGVRAALKRWWGREAGEGGKWRRGRKWAVVE